MHDLVIEGGSLIDVLNKKIYPCNVGIRGGKITTLSKESLSGEKKIDARGKLVSPGFIDIHMHEDPIVERGNALEIKEDIFKTMSKMGVTTCIGGNCGIGMTDIKEYFEIVEKNGLPVNFGSYLGYSALREKIGVSDNYRACTPEETKKIRSLVEKGLEDGALGVSFGLEYTPGSTTNEIIEIAKVVEGRSGKLLAAHFRSDADMGVEALKELIYISSVTKTPMQISHIGSCTGYGMMDDGLRVLEQARAEGINVMADCYPYEAFSTYVGSAVFDEGCFERWNKGYDALLATGGKYKGQRCTKEIFEYLRKEEPDTLVVAFVMEAEEIAKAISHPFIMVASDGLLQNSQGHPRAAGSFPRVIAHYVKKKQVLSLIDAICKMTLMPAERLGLTEKGAIKIGSDADLVIFDFESIQDGATFEEPVAAPTGISYVIVNGVSVVQEGVLTSERPGLPISF